MSTRIGGVEVHKELNDGCITTPVDATQRLPAELLSSIFLLCATKNMKEPNPKSVPFLLGRVCSAWRNIAYDLTPALWTELSVPHHQCTEIGLQLMQEWVARAGEYRVNLTIDYSGSIQPELNRPTFQGGFAAVVKHVGVLKITVPRDLFDMFPAIPADALRRLEVIDFAMSRRKPISGEPLGSSINFSACDRLHTVSLSGDNWTGFIQRGLVSNMPWARLAVLRVTERYLDGARARDIFFQCRNLKQCTLDIAMNATATDSGVLPLENAENGDIPPTTHPLLTSLAITFRGSGVKKTGPFFHGVTLPALEDLEVNMMLSERDSEDVPSVLLALQSRSGFSLSKLTLYNVNFGTEQLLQLLRALPTLVTLKLSHCSFLKSEIISALIYSISSRSPIFLPNLKYLHGHDTRMLVRDTLVLDMMESRQPRLQAPQTGVAELASVGVAVDVELGDSEFGQMPSPETMQRGVALGLAGLVMDYPRLTTEYWSGFSDSDSWDDSDGDSDSEEGWSLDQASSDEISSSTEGSSSSESEGSSENIESSEDSE